MDFTYYKITYQLVVSQKECCFPPGSSPLNKAIVWLLKADPTLGATLRAIFVNIGSASGTGRNDPIFTIVTSIVSCLMSIFYALRK